MITESIFDGKKYIIPMAEVCFIDKRLGGSCWAVMNGSRWNSVIDEWDNAVCLDGEEQEEFLRAWCRYRSEVEGITQPFDNIE